MLCLCIVAVFLMMAIPITVHSIDKPVSMEINEIVLLQYSAIIDNEKKEYDKFNTYITFNRKGNINQANTYYIDEIDVIVSLGSGRIYVKEY